jgi:phage terminase large subunit
MKLKIDTTITYSNVLDSTKRVSQHIGGTRSGKTYAILQYLLVEGLRSKIEITIVRKTVPSIKRTVFKDWKDILSKLNLWKDDNWKGADRVYYLSNGSSIVFLNTDDPEKLRGVKSDILFCDEASEVDAESYFQLAIRTTGKIILAFNPTISPMHWLRQMQDCDRFVTTYRDNPYLPIEMVRAIEELEYKSPKKWLVYGKGEYAPNERAIYQFQVVDEVEGEFVGFGVDFGWNDPIAIVAVFKNGDDLYVDEVVYESHLRIVDLIKKLNQIGIQKEELWCDSAEPRSIEELYRAGFNAKAVKKGADSKRFGISVLQNYRLHITKRSQNVLNEIYSYQYAMDRYGIVTEIPEDSFDHSLDALRYLAMSRLSIKQQQHGKYAIGIR